MTHLNISQLSNNYYNDRDGRLKQPQHPYHLVPQPRPFAVKLEAEGSPILSPSPSPHFTFGNYTHSQNPPTYRFGSVPDSQSSSSQPSPTPFTFMSSQPWPASYGNNTPNSMHHYDLPALQDTRTMSFQDDYEDGDELSELPDSAVSAGPSGSGTRKDEKQVRRRSSKACDQCRKSKCKCERTASNEPCKNCVLLGTACTFLGPSRKRGPPKGYIDAIEARLHQTEALIGILLASNDGRARTLFEDLSQDALAREIINRVDNSAYGTKGRRHGPDAPAPGGRTRHVSSRPSPPVQSQPTTNGEQLDIDLRSTHPSNEWQDQVTAKMQAIAQSRSRHGHSSSLDDSSIRFAPSTKDDRSIRPVSSTSDLPSSADQLDPSMSRRQRRRLDSEFDKRHISPSPHRATSRSPRVRHSFPQGQGQLQPSNNNNSVLLGNRRSVTSLTDMGSHYSGSLSHNSHSPEGYGEGDGQSSEETEDEEELADAVGQLSLNEHEEVRYHSKVSGLHLLGVEERVDGRSEGGIWKFPSSRVWPPLPNSVTAKVEDEFISKLPEPAIQEHLLELYFAYVHPALPVLHKKAFLEDYGNLNNADSPQSPDDTRMSPFRRRRRSVPTLLLLTMFAVASRYSTADTPFPPSGSMWPAGDTYLEQAKAILDSSYASSRPSTCQALLLMGYREVGIGAMAQAWLYIGMAVRMAQDLGMHKSADRWQRTMGTLFSPIEMQERKRIWYACVIMDKYISTYIGRPLAIFDRDFDNGLPSEDEAEEFEDWKPHVTEPFAADHGDLAPPMIPPTAGRVITCFNASAKLSMILSRLVQTIYPIHPVSGRHHEAHLIEKEVDKWYFELPEHLRFDPASPKTPAPLPHILTLHMQYWCTVILLHRPFIRHLTDARHRSPVSDNQDEPDVRAISKKNYDMCVRAANHITSIVSVYLQNFCIKRCSVYLCYYIFTASIMHVTTLTIYPNDPQARMGLTKLVEALQKMEVVWPSASRARQLINGSKVWLDEASHPRAADYAYNRQKRPLENSDGDMDHPHLPSIESAMRHSFGSPSSEPFSLGVDLHSNDPAHMEYFAAFDRWAGEPTLSFPPSLSTAVLPQQYSTGLVDDHRGSSSASTHIGRPMNGNGNSHSNGHGGDSRYPQYWSDYSSFGQLGSPYTLPALPGLAPPNGHGPAGSGGPPGHAGAPVFLHDQFSIFNGIPSSNP
ncbi:hypothetical protein JAAARDRAFT_38766 [Jaapia argillacea MUCL 33604]|uniref:Zn(2)-C6 fungal-type domain-containing protein n=1 Tax=Jaapia argillacea MUCL 33604 TaxID=933084 RepID=A0A067PS84_9AGAM|nr:hypothetical protein JAAARDRAFT_38766 [Jaapia argillacea MUCL 33604]